MTEFDAAFWRYEGPEGEKLAGTDFEAVNARLKGKAASAFRTRGLTNAAIWHVIIAGTEEALEQLAPIVQHGERLEEEPEPGMKDAVLSRFAQVALASAASGETFGRRRYLGGAEMDRAGRLHPRRPQG